MALLIITVIVTINNTKGATKRSQNTQFRSYDFCEKKVG